MAASKKKALNQNDLRRLMKERRDLGISESKRIDSPLAKYDNKGNLSCSICKVPIKNNGLWSAHLAGKIHKNTLEELKKLASTTQVIRTSEKRPRSSTNGSDIDGSYKKSKIEDPSRTSETSSKKGILPQDYTSSDNSDDDSKSETKTDNALTIPSPLPPGFFDNPPLESPLSPKSKKQEEGDISAINNTTTVLPEGFFDDPILDAKVRKVEYRDPMDEEWDKFQKTITEETNVSQAIIEEDLEESKLEREIDEIDEQMHNWSRVESLLQRKETISSKDVHEDDSGDGSTEEHNYDEFLDWRSKGVWKKS